MRLLPLLACLLFALTACRRADDALRPQRLAATYALLANPASLARIEGSTHTPGFHTTLGITQPADVRISGGYMYVPDAAQPRLAIYNLEAQQLAQTVTTPAICSGVYAGQRFILLLDSTRQRLYCMQRQWGISGFYTIQLDFTPLVAAHNADRFFIAGRSTTGEARATVLSEPALSRIGTYTLGPALTPTQLGLDGGYQPFVQLRASGGSYQQAGIDAFGYFAGTPTASTAQRVLYSPFTQVQFGTEYLRNVQQTGTTLNVSGFTDSAEMFDMDFRTSQLWYQVRDSLLQFDAARRARINGWPLAGQTLQRAAYHYVNE